jgi:hypothetical protein
MKLRDLIETCDLEKVYIFLHKRDAYNGTESKIGDVKKAYSSTIKELLSNKDVPSDDTILVKNVVDWYYTYLIENPKEAKTSTESKFCSDGVTLDKSQYVYINVNLKESSGEEIGIGDQSWASLISMEVENAENLSNEALLGEILWEITFHGFSEKKVESFWDGISSSTKGLGIK